ncbi:MFS transporter [Arcanobacterium phocisimile]|uniref:MFS transporter n=1 Tax=Arcanobacterium phocisimile TaxID=1302235 RepID=A0ABX7IEU7_9ACTO|nr:MFS transporter [Arcanobacterium phocisimile]QRV01537.1 MFS transporter [Arcanobacterium phocisimile]
MNTCVKTTNTTSSLWNRPDYRSWFLGDTAANFAGSIRMFALPFAVMALTGSAVRAGLIATMAQAIGIVCMIPGGIIIDRFDRRKLIYIFSILGITVWSLIAVLFATEKLTFPILVVLTSVGATNTGLFGSATDAVLRTIVRGEYLVKAQAANRGRDATVELAAPPLGAALYSFATWAPFASSVLGYLILGLCGGLIKSDLHPRGGVVEENPVEENSESGECTQNRTGIAKSFRNAYCTFIADFREGWGWIRNHRLVLRIALPLSLFNVGFTGTQYTYTYALVLSGRTPESIAVYNMAIALFAFGGAILAG